jgi:hypothetical protein
LNLSLSSKEQDLSHLLFIPKTKRFKIGNVSNLFSSPVKSVQASDNQSQNQQISCRGIEKYKVV